MKKSFYFIFFLLVIGNNTNKLLAEGDNQELPEIADVVKNLKTYKPWWGFRSEKPFVFTEKMAYVTAGMTGVAASGTALCLGGGASVFLAPMVTYWLSLNILYRFTPTGKYLSALGQFEKIAKKLTKKQFKTMGNSIEDVLLFAHQHFNQRTPLFSAAQFLKNMNGKLIDIRNSVHHVIEQSTKDELIEACEALLATIKTVQKPINAYRKHLMQHEDFEKQRALYYARKDMLITQRKREVQEQEKQLQEARERERDRDAALQNGSVGYQRIVK